jgi:transposase-like protein
MGKDTTNDDLVVQFRRDFQRELRGRIREAIQVVLGEELDAAVGCEAYERSTLRRGERNGTVTRTITTREGVQTLEVPRGRLYNEDGSTREFRSEILPRYARRIREVDEAILGVYLAGGNSRRIRKALEPLLGQTHLSKSAVSRVVARLKTLFAEWNERDLSSEGYPIIYLDGIALKVRLARRVVSVPVLAVLGVDEQGRKRLVALRLCVSEAEVHWRQLIEDLKKRGLPEPRVLISDGHPGLTRARSAWPGSKFQRCTQHKWENLKKHCPRHAHGELKRDWATIIRAKDGAAALEAYKAFERKWDKLCPPVAKSLAEAGLDLLTFYQFPKSMWKGLRTTNPVENLNREFRRRTKTQGSFSTEAAAVTLLYGLVAFGQIKFRRIDGHRALRSMLNEAKATAA